MGDGGGVGNEVVETSDDGIIGEGIVVAGVFVFVVIGDSDVVVKAQ